LVGKRVGFSREGEKGNTFTKSGAFAEYIVTNAWQCVEMESDLSWEQGACSFVNPLTAVGLLDKFREYGGRAAVQNGAASQLGRMMIKLFAEENIPLVNIVRRDEQIDLLKNEYGAKYVLNSSSADFDKDLFALCKELGCNVAFECVAGEDPGKILQCLDRGGICINYGMLSEKNIGPINPALFIYKGQRLETFFLPYYL
jgi:NADPH:quinone reductase-like Zn-dependent oxidoreductase